MSAGVVMLRGAGVALALALMLAGAGPAIAQGTEGWNPFRERDETVRRPRTPPRAAEPAMPGAGAGEPPPRDVEPWRPSPQVPPAVGSTVERIELQPLPPPLAGPSSAEPPAPADLARPAITPKRGPSAEFSALREDAWRGLDMDRLEKLLATIDIPPRSPALHQLWVKLLSASPAPPAGARGPLHFQAFQLEALYRSGRIDDLSERLGAAPAQGEEPLLTTFRIRADLVRGDAPAACDQVRSLLARGRALPKLLRADVQLMAGYCAAADGQAKGAGLAADLAREQEVDAPFALALLDHIGLGAQGPLPRLTWPKRLLVLDYRLLERAGPVDPAQIMPVAEPALLVALALDPKADPRLAVAAAEAAAAMHALTAGQLVATYARITLPQQPDPQFRRAALYRQVTQEADPTQRAATARALIDAGRRSGLQVVLAQAVAPMLVGPGSAANAETAVIAIEAALAARDFEAAQRLAAERAPEWSVLTEIADVRRRVGESSLGALDAAAQRGRFPPELLHRIVTVLDALDVNVPIPLWDAANRTPQPTGGHLPATGVLPQLGAAAQRGEVAHTVLLSISTIGPGGPAATKLIGLSDAIRSLRRIGLEADARAIALEALLAAWPR